MAQKSGHIYIIDHEPSEEEVAGFAKPVEFYVSENGKYYSILYDKNGNKYVQDASKVVTGFLKIGKITQDGNVYTIGVHPSGFNHWRINGVDITTANPSVLEVEPVSDGKFRVDYIVGNSGGGLFILPGVESKFPTELNPLDFPSFAFFQRILVTPDGLGGGGSDIDLSYEEVQSGSSTNFSINYDGDKTRFRIISEGQTPKNLQKIIFEEETDKAVEFILYNDHFLNVYPIASESEGLSKGFSDMNAPFVILPKSYAKLKYNPETDLIECWRVNSIGFSLPVNGGNGDVLEKDSGVFGGAKWVDRLGGLTTNFLTYWIGSKLANSIISQVAGRIGIGKTDPVEVLDVGGRAKANSFMLAENVAVSVPYEIGRKSGRIGYSAADGIFREILILGQTYEHQIRGKRVELASLSTSGTLTIDLNAGSHFAITLQSATTLVFSNMIPADETCSITMTISGNYVETIPSWLKIDNTSDIPNPANTREYTIVIKKGGVSPSGRYNVVNNI